MMRASTRHETHVGCSMFGRFLIRLRKAIELSALVIGITTAAVAAAATTAAKQGLRAHSRLWQRLVQRDCWLQSARALPMY